jgi:hypothetical protein
VSTERQVLLEVVYARAWAFLYAWDREGGEPLKVPSAASLREAIEALDEYDVRVVSLP